MTVWTVLTDAQIQADKPITQAQGRALRDNVSALAEGAAGAPTIIRDAISIGSSGVDGVFNDGAAPTAPGIFEFAPFTLTLARTFPHTTIMRCNGNFILSNTLTAGPINNASDARVAAALGCILGDNSPGAGSGSAGGGAGAGNGGAAVTPTTTALGHALSTTNRWWALRRGLVGGLGELDLAGGTGSSYGGGGLIILVNGNCTLTGGILDASAKAVAFTGAAYVGGGGGGSVILICSGTVTDGTFKANGAAGNGGSNSASGGGGGYVGVIASAYAGAQTLQANGGGLYGGGGLVGSAGYTEKITLTAKQINGLIFR